MFLIWSCIRIKGEVSRGQTKTKAPIVFILTVPRWILCCCYLSVVSYMALVLSPFVPHLSCFWYLGKVGLRNCGIS